MPSIRRTLCFLVALMAATVSVYVYAQEVCEPPDTSGESPVELFFEPAHLGQQPAISRPSNWEYQATAMREGDETEVWFCGGTIFGEGETIHRAMLSDTGADDPIQRVLPIPGTLPISRWDSRFHCSPSVIKHSHQAIYQGQELYYLYYECAAKFWDRTSQMFKDPGFTQICLAASFDGINFLVFNKDLYASNGVFGDPETVAPTPVVEAADLVRERCEYAFENGRHTVTFAPGECGGDALFYSYGSGHPNAVTIPTANGSKQIWLYYHDSAGNDLDRGVYLLKSWDGFQFLKPIRTNLKNANIKYFPNLTIDGQTGVFVSLTNYGSDNYYEYSVDGVTFQRAPVATPSGFPPREDQRLAEAREDLCVAPGASGIVGDKLGHVQDSRVEILSGEGYLASVPSKCTGQALATNPCPVPTPNTPDALTWDLYRIEGDFSVTSDFDGVDLSVDGSVIYHYADGMLYEYDCVDASCVESFLLFNRFNPDAYRKIPAGDMVSFLATHPLSLSMRPGRYDLRTRNFKGDGIGGRFYVDWQERLYSYQNWSSYVACNEDTNDFDVLTPDQFAKAQADYAPDFQGPRSCN